MDKTKYYKNLQKIILESELPKQTQYNLIIAVYNVRFQKCSCEIEKTKILKNREEFIDLFSFIPATNICEIYELTHQDAHHDFGHGDSGLTYSKSQVDSLAAGVTKCGSLPHRPWNDEIGFLNTKVEKVTNISDGYSTMHFTNDDLKVDGVMENFFRTLAFDRVFCVVDTATTSFYENIKTNPQVSTPPFWSICQTMQTLYDPANKVTYDGFGQKQNHYIFDSQNVRFCWQDPSRTKSTIYKQWPIDPTGDADETTKISEMIGVNADVCMYWNCTEAQAESDEYSKQFKDHSSCIYMKGQDGLSRWADRTLAAKTQQLNYSFKEHIKTTAEYISGLMQMKQINPQEAVTEVMWAINDLKYRQDFHFLSKRMGDMTQANICTEEFIELLTDNPVRFPDEEEKFRSNGLHNFVSYDSLAITAALSYGAPIVTKCYSKNSVEILPGNVSASGGCTVYVRNDLAMSNIPEMWQNIYKKASSLFQEVQIKMQAGATRPQKPPDLENVNIVNVRGEIYLADTSRVSTDGSTWFICRLPERIEKDVNDIADLWTNPGLQTWTIANPETPLKATLYLYVFMLEYYRRYDRMTFVINQFEIEKTEIQSVFGQWFDLFANIDVNTFVPKPGELFNMNKILKKLENLTTSYDYVAKEYTLYNQTFWIPPDTPPPLSEMTDFSYKVLNFDVTPPQQGKTRGKSFVINDKYLSYKDLLEPLAIGPFGYKDKYPKYYSILRERIETVVQLNAESSRSPRGKLTGFEGEFYLNFDKYLPPTETKGNPQDFSPLPLNATTMEYGVYQTPDLDADDLSDEWDGPIGTDKAIAPRKRFDATDDDIYINVINKAIDILPYIKFDQTYEVTKMKTLNIDISSDDIEQWKVGGQNSSIASLPYSQINNTNFKYTDSFKRYRYSLFYQFYAYVGGVLTSDFEKDAQTKENGVWAPAQTLSMIAANYPVDQHLPVLRSFCNIESIPRADIFVNCINERVWPAIEAGFATPDVLLPGQEKFSVATIFYHDLLEICNSMNEELSPVDLIPKLINNRSDYITATGWSEERMDEFIYFDGEYLDTNCSFYRFFVKDFLYYAGLVDFDPNVIAQGGITQFLITNYPELISTDSNGRPQSILTNVLTTQ